MQMSRSYMYCAISTVRRPLHGHAQASDTLQNTSESETNTITEPVSSVGTCQTSLSQPNVGLTVAGSCTAAVPGRTSLSPPASVFASEPPPTPSGDRAGCTRPDRCCRSWTENSEGAARLPCDRHLSVRVHLNSVQ